MNRSQHHAQPAGVTARQLGPGATFIHGAGRWLHAAVWGLAWSICLIGANAGAQTDPAVAEALVKQSGLWEQLGPLPGQMRMELLQSVQPTNSQPTPAELKRMQKIMDTAFAAERLRARVVQVVTERLQPGHQGAIQAWFLSPVGERLVHAELANSGEPIDPIELSAQGLEAFEAATPARKALIMDVLKTTHAVEGSVQLVTGLALAIRRGVVAARPDGSSETEGELRAEIEGARPRLQQFFTILVAGTVSANYKNISDGELSRYLAFLNSEPGQHFNALALLAVGAAMDDASEEFGRLLMSTQDSVNP